MKKVLHFLFMITMIATVTSCKKSDPPMPDNTINFEAAKQGLEASSAEAVLKINLARATDAAVAVTVNLQGTGLTYGTEYTTEPAATANALTLSIPAGATSVSFKVKKVANAVLNGTETIAFNISAAGSPLVMGSTVKTELTFSAITSEGSQLTLKGIFGTEAGSSALNTVYVDLSSNSMVNVKRDAWVLGFSSGTDFRVRLNNTNGTSAVKIAGKTDLNAVTAADVVLDDLAIALGTSESPTVHPFVNIDNVYGDVTKDVIASVSATDADNKVFIVNPSGGSHTSELSLDNLLKIRVLRKVNGYTLQYAKLKETTFKTIDLVKDAANNYVFVNFTTVANVLNVEPAKAKWDLAWTWSIYYGAAGGTTYPYGFSDIVFLNNLGGAQAAQVATTTVSYANYNESNIAATSFKADRNVIGSDWRSTSPATGVKSDRFYVIKDASGNVYKLKFISMGAGDGGKRGEPVIEYKLVKKG
ncbi:HmuY family protein [Pedobacter gandavensis]|uniref:HmuY family protein n=1 Tax=Pedobacter gandavensis TaxID=2679963 RepID=UPI00292D3BE4|nr:HmuY family protein [Pedobacter gandavensis]